MHPIIRSGTTHVTFPSFNDIHFCLEWFTSDWSGPT
jgi:hypothetical protein